ncbi:MAG: GTP-binding protein TypA/BipA [Parcubacteria group bacterium GW2011_GWA2_47_16]|nr:MAG: GTP-binding protein TypA/BipA [Parcubacteria group bacterium GW2011_GWA2_47_16]
MEIRNIAIIAHVDHGKTTLTDALMRQTGMVKDEKASMDSNALEQERGITIYSKNCSLYYKDTKINIVDTPGHADFGSEVERVLRSIDTVLLLVDAQEGPMPQTRFVLKKSLELGLKPIVIINKIDKPAARITEVHDEILELFLELGATEKQIDFKTIYAIGRQGIAKINLTDDSKNLDPLLDLILSDVSPAGKTLSEPLRMQPFNLAYDNFLGRLAIGRIYDGTIKQGETVYIKKPVGDEIETGKITKLFTFEGITRKEVTEAFAGDIVMVAGLPTIYIGETITDSPETAPLPAIAVDEPTISLNFLVNDSPLAGREGKLVTTRQIRARLEKELEVNVGLKVDFSPTASGQGTKDTFKVYGRGELHISILLEYMRREGFELQVSQPQVIIKDIDGVKSEPFEEAIIDVRTENASSVIQKLSKRKGILMEHKEHENIARLTFEIPTRGLLGYRGEFVIDTKGEGLLSSRFIGFKPYSGVIEKHSFGSMISMETGTALAYSIWNLQERGTIYIDPATPVYEGMIIGNVTKGEDMDVNPTKNKQLTNVRMSGNDDAILVIPPLRLTIERGLEIMQGDEYLEITPKSVRLRKQHLTRADRARALRKEEK